MMRLKLEMEEKKQAMVLLQRALVSPSAITPGCWLGWGLPAPCRRGLRHRHPRGYAPHGLVTPFRSSSVTSPSDVLRRQRRS